MNDREADRSLVARMLKGQERAFEAFFERYFPGLYRFALTRVDYDGAVAEEIVQAALALAVLKLSTFRGGAALFTLLCAFCRNELSAYGLRGFGEPNGRGRRAHSHATSVRNSKCAWKKITGLTAEEAVAAVLPTCGLTHRVEGGALVVRKS